MAELIKVCGGLLWGHSGHESESWTLHSILVPIDKNVPHAQVGPTPLLPLNSKRSERCLLHLGSTLSPLVLGVLFAVWQTHLLAAVLGLSAYADAETFLIANAAFHQAWWCDAFSFTMLVFMNQHFSFGYLYLRHSSFLLSVISLRLRISLVIVPYKCCLLVFVTLPSRMYNSTVRLPLCKLPLLLRI